VQYAALHLLFATYHSCTFINYRKLSLPSEWVAFWALPVSVQEAIHSDSQRIITKEVSKMRRLRASSIVRTVRAQVLPKLPLAGLVAIIAGVWIAGLIVGGYVKMLWGWFVQPLGIRSLTIGQAIGIWVMVDILTYHHQYNDSGNDNEERIIYSLVVDLVVDIVRPLAALGVGYIVHVAMAG